jgi:hypothetical protein
VKFVDEGEDGNMEEKKASKGKKSSEKYEVRGKRKKQKDLSSGTSQSVKPSKTETKENKKRKRDEEDSTSKAKKKSKYDKKRKADTDELEIDITAPTPPSKKARRLQKRGKRIPKLPSTSQPPTTLAPPTGEENIHPDRKKLVKDVPRADWAVWIGNLAYKSDVKSLRGWLVRTDKRVTDKEITRIHLPLNADGQSKGYILHILTR